ncbi:MAG TPA: hypothetical protein VJY39_11395 [Acidisphaera sp.]|nr:hypothetical protein [Acidisphaera sp.]HME28123.1 hypothetical protein [Acetobacteraceae bacterium]
MADQKKEDATKKPAPDAKSDELSEKDVAEVTGGRKAGGEQEELLPAV